MDFLNFALSGFWTFWGVIILLSVITTFVYCCFYVSLDFIMKCYNTTCNAICVLFKGYPNK